MPWQRAAVIIGVGPVQGLGATLANYCSQQGLHVFIAGRSADKLKQVASVIQSHNGSVTEVVADATNVYDVKQLFARVAEQQCQVEIAIYNVDSNGFAPFLATTLDRFTELWQQNTLAAFIFAQAAITAMLPHQQGSLFFTGATASLRAKPPFTAFASAKAGLRALAQGLAREFGPQGLHVVHVVLDGVLDGNRARTQFPAFVQAKGEEGLMQLTAIAETYWAIHQQHKSAWTHELDLRPFKEPF